MAKRLRGIDVDDSAVMKLTGFMDTLSKDLGKSRTLNPVMKYVYGELDKNFTMHMAKTAVGQPDRFHHVYEWGLLGVPQAQLWDTTLGGSGSQRAIGFNWRASKSQVPLPDPLPPESKGGKQLQGGHVFVWKAPVMEYGLSVNIAPVQSDNLAFMASDIRQRPMRNGLWFSNRSVRFDKAPNSKLAYGSFTKEFLEWWGGSGADKAFNGSIKDVVERGIGAPAVAKAIRAARMNAAKGRGGAISREAAQDAGRERAEEFLREREDWFAQRMDIRSARDSGGRFTGGR